MTTRRFYFQIKSANVLECVTASSLTEAKLIDADWLIYSACAACETDISWDEWINTEETDA